MDLGVFVNDEIGDNKMLFGWQNAIRTTLWRTDILDEGSEQEEERDEGQCQTRSQE